MVIRSGHSITINTAFASSNTIVNDGAITTTASLTFNSGATYIHYLNRGTIPSATWNASSNCMIIGITNGPFAGGSNQTFGNVIWNCASQAGTYFLDAVNITGDLIVQNTNGFEARPTDGRANTVGGNYYQNGGYIRWAYSLPSSLTVSGNVVISGGECRLSNLTGDGVGTLNVNGDLTISGGGLTELGSTACQVSFVRSGTQTFLKTSGTISGNINFSVNNGSTLDVGTSIIDGSTGTFKLNSGAGIITAHPQGLSTGTGSIQVTGTKTFNTGANYTYNGLVAQITGDGLPNSVRRLTVNNPSGITLTNGVSVNNLLTMSSGNVNCGSNTLILTSTSSGSLSHTSGTIIGKFQRGVGSTDTDYLFPVGTLSYYTPATFRFSSLASSVDITAEFVESSPGVISPPYTDGTLLTNTFEDGYWHFSSSGTPSNTYTITLTGNGFTSYVVDGNTRITGRTSSLTNWHLIGNHGSITNQTITRTNISNLDVTAFDYAFATSCSSNANAGSDAVICKVPLFNLMVQAEGHIRGIHLMV